MKYALPKNRTAPLIFFAVLSIALTLILGILQLNRMIQYSYKEKMEAYDLLTDDITALLNQEIENQYQALQIAANLIAENKSNINSSEALQSLKSMKKFYVDLAIVDLEGHGYSTTGNSINIANETYYQVAKNGYVGTSENISYTENNQPVIDIAIPIIDKRKQKGVLVAKINSCLKETIPYLADTDNLIYIINENKELIAYIQDTGIDKFNYNSLISNGYLRKEAEDTIPDVNLKDFFIKNPKNNDQYIWDEKALDLNNWSVLIGRANIINPIAKDIFKLTNMMWIFISICMLFLFTLMIIIQRRSNRKVIKMLYLDPVTGGDNWYKFRILVNKLLTAKSLGKRQYALINFDINRFKFINDVYGYQKGDQVLKEIYNIIKRWAQFSEPFTRYAADQFYILLSFKNEKDIKERVYELNNVLHQFRYTKTSRISYGVYIINEDQDSVDRMAEFASIAKMNKKGSTDGMISFFDDTVRNRLFEEENIENAMSDALKNEEFHVYLQPKYATKEEKISGAEALVRWFNNEGKIVSPANFIPVFEKNGFITQLDFYMLKKVCMLIRSWLDKGFSPFPISVNISRLHFANPHLAVAINDIVDNYKVPHNLIELELTESAFLQDKQMLITTVNLLRKYGFIVSMDDFGAGYSSLNSLKDLPLDIVKLDGELFQIKNELERGLTIIRNTITMAKDLHMKVVAECIETREQVEYLCKAGCDMIQGYYFAKPMPIDMFEQRYFMLSGID